MLYVIKSGRNPEFALAEVTSKQTCTVLDSNRGYLLCDAQTPINFNVCGSVPMAFTVIDKFRDNDFDSFINCITSNTNEIKRYFLDSNYLTPKQIQLISTSLKKKFKGRTSSKVSFFNVKNTASVFNEVKKSDTTTGFGIFRLDRNYYICKFEFVQNLDSYTLRDFHKPFRDAKLGMLPPKLAQTMIGLLPKKTIHTIYDPFCGTGTVCFESVLAGYNSWGSDILESNIDGSNLNLEFFIEKFSANKSLFNYFQADATTLKKLPENFAIVTEGYLGKPKKGNESKTELAMDFKSVVSIYNNFFLNLHKIAFKKKFFVVISVPEFKYLASTKNPEKIFANLRNYGYIFRTVVPSNRLGIDSSRVLHYSREDQFVSRNIICLEHIPG
jgi:tRNA G10  N-methylase Trm11